MDGQTDRQTGRQTGRQADRQTDIQNLSAETELIINIFICSVRIYAYAREGKHVHVHV